MNEDDPESIVRYRMAVLDNKPPRVMSVTGILSYLHSIAVIAGGITDDAVVVKAMPKVAPVSYRSPYPDDRESA